MDKKHIPLIGAILLPIIFISILALVILVPASKLNPQFDFVYINMNEQYSNRSMSGEIRFRNTYDVDNNQIVKKEINYPAPLSERDRIYYEQIEYKEAPTLYYYDFETESSREISFEEVQAFTITEGTTSPDGYTVGFDSSHDGIFELFGSSDDSGYVIKKDSAQKKITGLSPDAFDLYRYDLEIIGWINN